MNKFELYFQSRLSEIKKSFPNVFSDSYFKDRINVTILIFSGILLLIVWIMMAVGIHINEYTIPLRYNSFLGVTELGGSISLYRIPIFLSFCFIVNVFLSRIIYKKDRLISYILCGTNLILGVISIIIIANFIKIIGA